MSEETEYARYLRENPNSLEAQRARQRAAGPVDIEAKLRAELDAMPPHIKALALGATVEQSGRSVVATEGGVAEHYESTRLTAAFYDSSTQRLATEIARALQDRALAEEGSLQAQRLDQKIAQLKQTYDYQVLVVNEQAAREQSRQDEILSGMERDSALLDERLSDLTVDGRRAKYGLVPLGSVPAAIRGALNDQTGGSENGAPAAA
jgi:hypothetical protein